MKLDAIGHTRVTPLTDCGCRPAGEPVLAVDVPVHMNVEPVIGNDLVNGFEVELSIDRLLAGAGVTDHAMIEVWVDTHNATVTAIERYGCIVLRHLVNGTTAEPWTRCPDHGGTPGDQPGPAIVVMGPGLLTPTDPPGWN